MVSSSFYNRFLCEVFASRYLDVDWLAYTLHTQFYYLGIIFKSLVTRKYFIPRFRFLKALSCRALDWPEFISVGMLLDKFNSLWVNGRQKPLSAVCTVCILWIFFLLFTTTRYLFQKTLRSFNRLLILTTFTQWYSKLFDTAI